MVLLVDDLNISRGCLGTGEDPDGSNHNFITDWYADRINNDGFRRAPWCAMSRSYTYDTASGDLTYAYVPFVEADAKAGRNGLVWLGMNAEEGAWVIIDFNRDGLADHIGQVEVANGDGTIVTLEGNISNGYRRQKRDMKYVRGFVRVPYDGVAPAPVPDPGPGETPTEVGRTMLPNVRRGSRGRAVKFVQVLTSAEGGPDGDFGANTRAAVEQFQAGHPPLRADGEVGPKTWTALLQAGLAFVAGAQLDVDGQFGPATTAAVIEFQRSNGLTVDGIAGYETFGAITAQ